MLENKRIYKQCVFIIMLMNIVVKDHVPHGDHPAYAQPANYQVQEH